MTNLKRVILYHFDGRKEIPVACYNWMGIYETVFPHKYLEPQIDKHYDLLCVELDRLVEHGKIASYCLEEFIKEKGRFENET